jgi:hypothetical protein
MTDLLKQALAEAEQTFSPEEQDELGRWLLDFVNDERKWATAFQHPKSPGLLERLAAAALEAERAGRTDTLDPDAL